MTTAQLFQDRASIAIAVDAIETDSGHSTVRIRARSGFDRCSMPATHSRGVLVHEPRAAVGPIADTRSVGARLCSTLDWRHVAAVLFSRSARDRPLRRGGRETPLPPGTVWTRAD